MLLTVFRIVCLVIIYFGAVNSFDLAWNLADIFMGFMAIVNLIAILLLGKWAIKALDDYTEQRNAGKDPVFVADKVEGLPKTQCWHIGEDDLKDVGEQPVKDGSQAARVNLEDVCHLANGVAQTLVIVHEAACYGRLLYLLAIRGFVRHYRMIKC